MPFGVKKTNLSSISPDELFEQTKAKFDDKSGSHQEIVTACRTLIDFPTPHPYKHQSYRIMAETLKFMLMKMGEAFECFEKSIQDECKPPNMSSKEWTREKIKTYDRMAELCKDIYDHDNAEKYWRLALNLDGDNIDVYDNFLKFLKDNGRTEDCLAFYEEFYGGLALEKKHYRSALAHLFAFNYVCSDKEAADKLYLDHLSVGKSLEAEYAQHKITHHRNTKDPTRRLKVAYVSPDLDGTHAVARFAWAALDLDKSKFELTVYNCKDFSKCKFEIFSMSHLVDRWVDAFNCSTGQLLAKIVADEIDILVDLAGYTSNNRLDVFACCPAPIQVTWIGHPNTTGLSVMHYRVTDTVTDPVDTSQRFSENLIRLPDCFLCYNIQHDEKMPRYNELPAVVSPPCIQNGYITFGCFNKATKVQPAVVDLWIRVLQQVPASRINIKSACFDAPCIREKWYTKFEANGIDRQRVNLLRIAKEQEDHLSLYGQHDISLDTFPYSGTTTTVESLLMGVPVVTLRTPASASIHAHNVSAGILTVLGLPDLVANSPDEYVDVASKLAADTVRLIFLRENLRSDWGKSPMGDVERYRRNVEEMYQSMWDEYCQGSNWPPNSRDRDIA